MQTFLLETLSWFLSDIHLSPQQSSSVSLHNKYVTICPSKNRLKMLYVFIQNKYKNKRNGL